MSEVRKSPSLHRVSLGLGLAIGAYSLLGGCTSEPKRATPTPTEASLPETKVITANGESLKLGRKLTDIQTITPGFISQKFSVEPRSAHVESEDLAAIYSPEYNDLLNKTVRQRPGFSNRGDTAALLSTEYGKTYLNTVSLNRETQEIISFGGREELTAPKFLYHFVSLEHHTDTAVSVQPSTTSVGGAEVIIQVQPAPTP